MFNKEHIAKVNAIIKEVDSFEQEYYMPDDWVCFWNYPEDSAPEFVYNGKFDIDVIALTKACAEQGIAIMVDSIFVEEY